MEITLEVLSQRVAGDPDECSQIPLLHNAIKAATNRDPHRAQEAAREAVALSERCGDIWSLAMSWLLFGRALVGVARYREGRTASEQAARLFEQQGDTLNAAYALSDAGSALVSLSEYTAAFDCISRSLALAEQLRSDSVLMYSLNRMGYLWQRLGNRTQALMCWQRGLALAMRFGNEDLQSTIGNNIASIHVELGERQQALRYFEQSLAHARACKDIHREGTVLVNLGELLQTEGRTDEALQYQQLALRLFRELGNSHFEGVVLSNMGRLFERQGDFQQALRYQQEAADILTYSADRQDTLKVQLRLGVLYRRLGELQRSIDILLQAQGAAADVGAEHLKSKICRQLALSYEQQGAYREALGQYQQYISLRRSVMSANKLDIADRMRLRSEVEVTLREKEIQRLKNTELAEALEKVRALSLHYRTLHAQNSLLVEAVTRKLRAPLECISSVARGLYERSLALPGATVEKGQLAAMEYEAQAASRTVDMLLLAHAVDAGKFEPDVEQLDVGALLADIVEDMAAEAVKAGVDIRCTFSGAFTIVSDAGVLRHAVYILISNAVLYAERGSSVLVQLVYDAGIVLHVSNRGSALPRPLVRWFAAHDSANDAVPPGSGLSMIKLFSAVLQGSVHYKRVRGRSCFSLVLPAVLSRHL